MGGGGPLPADGVGTEREGEMTVSCRERGGGGGRRGGLGDNQTMAFCGFVIRLKLHCGVYVCVSFVHKCAKKNITVLTSFNL